MTTSVVKSIPYLFLLAIFGVPLASHSATGDYDGKWGAAITCGVNSVNGRPGFINNTDFNVQLGKIKETKVAATQLGKDENTWSGQFENGKLSLNAAGKRDSGGSWEWKFVGKAISNDSISLDGAMFSEGKQIRDCSIKMNLTMPAATSLAEKSKTIPVVTPPVQVSTSSAKVALAEKPTQAAVPAVVTSKVEKGPAIVEVLKQTQTAVPSATSTLPKDVVANNTAPAITIASSVNNEIAPKTESVGDSNKEGAAAVEQRDTAQPVVKVETAPIVPLKPDAVDQFNWGEILKSPYVKYGVMALIALAALWLISVLMKRIASNVKDMSKDLAESKDALKQELTDKMAEAKSVATLKLQTAKTAVSEASVKISEAASEASRAASKKIEDNSSNIQNIKFKYRLILDWTSKKWTPIKQAALNSKFGVKFPRLAKIILNGWVISAYTLYILAAIIFGDSNPYKKYNDSKDYSSCISASAAAGRLSAKRNGYDVQGTIASLKSDCGENGANSNVEDNEAFNTKANDPICVNQVRSAKDSCMGARGNLDIYLQCIKANTPACPNN